MSDAAHSIVEMRDVRFSYDGGETWALDGIGFCVREGERIALVGANGSGKSTLALLTAGLTAPDSGTIELAGELVFDDAEGARADAYRRARRDIGIVFQNPEDQIVTTVVCEDVAFGPENLATPRAQIGERVHDALATVGMTTFADANPANLSGGQQQRVAIAGMLAMHSRLLILDEPTAMLDPDARADVLTALDDIQSRGTSIIIVTHSAEELAHATRIIRLEHGRILSDEPVDDASHPPSTMTPSACPDNALPITSPNDALPAAQVDDALPAASPDATVPPAPQTDVSTTVRGTLPDAVRFDHVTYAYPGDAAPILDDYSLRVARGSTMAIVGRNGSGKTTFAKLLCALLKPDSGTITVDGVTLTKANRKERATLRRSLGFIMQHPERQLFAPTVAQDVAYGPRNQGLDKEETQHRVEDALHIVGAGHLADRDPFTLSGGQQRLVAIAGVLACHPNVLVMDEPTASLDETACARIRGIIRRLHDQGVTIVMITHDLAMAHTLADSIVDFPGNAHPSTHSSTNANRATGSTSSPTAKSSVHVVTGSATTAGNTNATRSSTHTTDSDTRATGNSLADTSSRPQAAAHETMSMSDPHYSWIASLDPRAKMLGILALMFSAFAMSSWPQLLIGGIATGVIACASRIGLRRLLSSVRVFLILFAVTGLLNLAVVHDGTPLAHIGGWAITTGGIHIALLYMLRFAFVIILGAVVLLTTTPTAMSNAFERMLHPLRRWIHVQEICLVLSLSLRFLPTLVTEAVSIRDAQAARGGSIESGTLPQRVRAMCAIVIPVFAGAIRHADNLALALDARCYQEGVRRTLWHPLRMHMRDWVFCICIVATILAIIAVRVFNM
ncbi:MAG: energy-coupling factor transporter ATPase [Bifidobacterium criceti]|nr:energy-coupling factor transporter ATPase [Bifidobacterium criceti]